MRHDELPLDLVDELEVQIEQPAQEARGQPQGLLAVRERPSARASISSSLALQVRDVGAQRADALARHRLAHEVGDQQPQQRLALDAA